MEATSEFARVSDWNTKRKVFPTGQHYILDVLGGYLVALGAIISDSGGQNGRGRGKGRVGGSGKGFLPPR